VTLRYADCPLEMPRPLNSPILSSFCCLFLASVQDEYTATVRIKQAASRAKRTDSRDVSLSPRSSLEEHEISDRQILHSLPLLESSGTSTHVHSSRRTSQQQPHQSQLSHQQPHQSQLSHQHARATSPCGATKRSTDRLASPVSAAASASRSRSPASQLQKGGSLVPTGSAERDWGRRGSRRERSSSVVKSPSPTRDKFKRSGSPTGSRGMTNRLSPRDVIAPFHDKVLKSREADSIWRLGSREALDEVRYTTSFKLSLLALFPTHTLLPSFCPRFLALPLAKFLHHFTSKSEHEPKQN